MAKVSPLHGRRKYDWKLRFMCLLNELGQEAFAQAEEGSTNAGYNVTRRGTRLSVNVRTWRNKTETSVRIYTKSGHYHYISRLDKKDLVGMNPRDESMFDFKDNYKRLERLIYSHMAPSRAADIMSRGDDAYSWSIGNE